VICSTPGRQRPRADSEGFALTPPYSLESYRSIVHQALSSGYAFVPFSLEPRFSGKRIYLRHDVDYSLEMALRLAETNAELGIQGTFCVLLRSQIYNLLSRPSMEVVSKIHALGQHVGLHVPLQLAQPADDRLLEAHLRADFEFVRSNLPMVSPVYSWHNPPGEALERYLEYSVMAGLVNAYLAPFFRDIAYYSDSNMRYSVEEFLRLVGESGCQAMQLVLHPLHWVAGGTCMRDVFSTTWRYIIREREREVRLNRYYATVFPEGMPERVLDTFSDEWGLAAEEKKP